MDKTDEKIINMLKGNARMSYQDIGDAIGMSRVAAKKRVQKLEKEGIIRGYNTCIYKPGEIRSLGAKSAREIMEKLFLFQYDLLSDRKREDFLAEVLLINCRQLHQDGE